MVHYQVKAHVIQVHLLHLVVELASLEHFESIAIDVEHFIGLNLSVATLDDALLVKRDLSFAKFLQV